MKLWRDRVVMVEVLLAESWGHVTQSQASLRNDFVLQVASVPLPVCAAITLHWSFCATEVHPACKKVATRASLLYLKANPRLVVLLAPVTCPAHGQCSTMCRCQFVSHIQAWRACARLQLVDCWLRMYIGWTRVRPGLRRVKSMMRCLCTKGMGH